MSQFYTDCPEFKVGAPLTTECGTSKQTTWSSPTGKTETFLVQNINQQLISFVFSGITNNGSSVTVDVIYPRDGVTITAQTFNLGVIVSNTTKYHYLNFGNTNQTNGLITLKYTIAGGTSGVINTKLNCSVSVGTRSFCYQIVKSAPRNLCRTCPSEVKVYYQKTTTNGNENFSYDTWYSDPELQTLSSSGYYAIKDQPSPKMVYLYTGTTPQISYYCDPRYFDCGNSLSQSHPLSSYTFNNPYIKGTQGIQIDGYKYSIMEYFVDITTTHGYVELNVSNTQTYQTKVVFTVSDANAKEGTIGALSYTEGTPNSSEFFTAMAPQTLFKVANNSTKKIYVLVNGDRNNLTRTLRVRVGVALPKTFTNNGATQVQSTVSASCVTQIFSQTAGIHVYSDYDAANSPKCTTVLYSLQNPNSWVVNSKVWNDPFLLSPALPYYYSFGTKVYKVGQPYKREFGTKTIYNLKTNGVRQLLKKLGLSKKNPVTVTPVILGPKDWQTSTQVPACIDQVMQDTGIITSVSNISGLPIPTSYLYLVGKNASSKITANDSVFTQYDFNKKTHKPITGLMHATNKLGAAYSKASKDETIKRAVGSEAAPWAALGLGALAAAIAITPGAFGLAVGGAIPCILPTVGGATLPTVGALTATGVGIIVAAIIAAIVLLFVNTKTTVEEDCKLFDKVYGSNEYLELGNTIYTNSGLTTNGITGYYTDGGYFYTTNNGAITAKELSYTNIDGARTYSITPDNPTNITSFLNLLLLPYISGRPVAWSTIRFKSRPKTASAIPTTKVGELNTAATISYDLPEGFFDASTQAEADALADNYISSLTANTVDILISANQIDGITANTTTFTHEIKVEDTPAVWPVCYNNTDTDGLKVGRKIFYDSNGLYSVLDGYYSVDNIGGVFRRFYKTSGGTIVDYFDMSTSASTTATSPTSGSVSVVTTGKTYTSSWYFYGSSKEDVLYDDSNDLHGFTQTWNTSTFYNSVYVKRGMIETPITKTNFKIFDNNTNLYSFSNAEEGWYQEVPNIFNQEPFLIQSAFTIYLDSIQYCSDDEDNGVYVTCVDVSGNTLPSFYGVEGSISITTTSGTTSHDFVIENNDYRYLVPLPTSYINAISNITLNITSTNPINGITFTTGTTYTCNTATPTPTPVVSPDPTPTVTPTPTPTITVTPSITPTLTPTPSSLVLSTVFTSIGYSDPPCSVGGYTIARRAQLDEFSIPVRFYSYLGTPVPFNGNNLWYAVDDCQSYQIDTNGYVIASSNCC